MSRGQWRAAMRGHGWTIDTLETHGVFRYRLRLHGGPSSKYGRGVIVAIGDSLTELHAIALKLRGREHA